MQASADRFLSRQEVADRYGIPARTLDQWASLGKGPRFIKIGRYARYRLEDVVAWENAQQMGGDAA
ncbi:helix-turn-helix transcriptional regulator [Rhodococcus pyridinivorans]|uniref:helix-turn-helix transcriptional regulator n=1 Tax=Rhodococcus pyridinivorans TaxID=103816 RepID=UPI00110EF949|nr:helix-turn-helix domain-containing protein [Rhodococcus pyridinivorans]